MMRDHWFYSDQDEHTVKSLRQLMGMYYYSVGRGANLLLNVGPDRNGLLPEKDAKRLLEFGQEIKRCFSNPIAGLSSFTIEEARLVYTPETAVLIDHVVMQEALEHGESVRSFNIKVAPHPYGDPIIVYEGKNIGHKAICPFSPIKAVQVIIEITESDGDWKLNHIELYGEE